MNFNEMTVWRVRVWLFAIGVILIAGRTPLAAQRLDVARAECPAFTTTAVRRFFTLAPHGPGPTACQHGRDQRAALSRLPI